VVSWVPQIVVPPLVALAFFRRLPRKWVMWMAPTIFLSDLDYLVPGEHRVYTHNLFIPVLVMLVLGLWWRKRGRLEPFMEFASRPGKPVALLLMAYYMAAHSVMDVFTGGVVLLWPISNFNYYIDFEIYLNTSTNTFEPVAEAGRSNGPFPLDPVYSWFTMEHAAVLGFILVVAFVALGWRLVRRLRARKSPPT